MDEVQGVAALAALAQVQRLRAFRALVVAGPDGLTPSIIAEQLGVAAIAAGGLLSWHVDPPYSPTLRSNASAAR